MPEEIPSQKNQMHSALTGNAFGLMAAREWGLYVSHHVAGRRK
jgi:hypothetical protein